MKVLLALSLLFFFDSVFSQGDIISCSISGTCPKGYSKQDIGLPMLNVLCQCKKDAQKSSGCSAAAVACKNNPDEMCDDIESKCTPRELIDVCNNGGFPIPMFCDRASREIRREKYAGKEEQCDVSANRCEKGFSVYCTKAVAICEPDVIVQLCEKKYITSKDICEAAEIQKEKDRTDDRKYTCDDAQKKCLTDLNLRVCKEIFRMCDVETAAKWCLKYDVKEIRKMKDEDCTRVVTKFQDLMFGKNKPECWKQVTLCEGGNSEACKQVPRLCVKNVVLALCHVKKIKDEHICKFAGSGAETSDAFFQACKFFDKQCLYGDREVEYCTLSQNYCD